MKAFIFDLDGVIVSTDKLHYRAWKQMADKEGIYFDEKINDRLRGVSRMDSLEIVLERATKTYTEQEKVKLAEFKNEIYKQSLTLLTENDRLEGVTETLEVLREKGFLLAIGSSSKNAKPILKQIGYENYFDAVSDGTNISKSKPDPEVFIKASEMLGLKPSDCFVVEDAVAGIIAGENGGFKTFGLGEASIYEKTTYPIKTISQILDHV